MTDQAAVIEAIAAEIDRHNATMAGLLADLRAETAPAAVQLDGQADDRKHPDQYRDDEIISAIEAANIFKQEKPRARQWARNWAKLEGRTEDRRSPMIRVEYLRKRIAEYRPRRAT